MIALAESRAIVLPRFLLGGAIGLVMLTIVGAAALRLGRARPVGLPEAESPIVAVRDLRFSDLANGGVGVVDAGTGAPVATLAPGTNGFIRGTLRGLARERHRRGEGPETPVRLLARRDGSLTLVDPATGIRIEVGSFGSDNDRAVRRLLPTP